ncbi:glycogen debranching N-terminal domain-containing protein, partial [Bacillus cereus]
LSLRLTLEGEEVAVEPLTQLDLESGHTRFVNALRIEGDTADPKILLVRDRVVDIEGVREQMAVQNASSKAFVLTLELQVSPDLSSMEKIKSGKPARA